MNKLKVYEAEPSDAKSILTVHHDAVHENVAVRDSYPEVEVRDAWSPTITNEKIVKMKENILLGKDSSDKNVCERFFIARRAEKMIGYGSIRLQVSTKDVEEVYGPNDVDFEEIQTISRICGLYVSPNLMLHQYGDGTAILNYLEGVAVQAGKRILLLNSTLNATEFYKKRGFECVYPHHDYIFRTGVRMKCNGMQKWLRGE